MSGTALSAEKVIEPGSSLQSARAASRQAEQRAGVEIRALASLEEIHAAADLWHKVWERDGSPPVTSDMLRALAHAGNYVGGAFAGGRMVGALFGFYAGHNGADHLHSHILGVDDSTRVRGVGFALKLHQRTWALERGIERITWTYDPLVRANGYFNISKLGAEGVEYLEDFYGPMPDTINAGDESDRVLVSWDLTSPRVEAAAAGTSTEVDVEVLLRSGAVVGLSVGPAGEPVAGPAGDGLVVCQAPADIVALRRADPGSARGWRPALREVMGQAFERGLRVEGMNRDGWYLLVRPEQA